MSDRLSPDVRFIFVSLLGGLLLFGLPLYFFPANTTLYWAWIIPQPRSAILLGALYLAGAVYYVMALRADSWRAVENNLPGLFLFLMVVQASAMIHSDSLRGYHPMGLLWMTSYYAALLFLPIMGRVQFASRGRSPESGARLTAVWRTWLVVRGVIYLAAAVLGFLLVPTLTALWPWAIEPIDLRMFMGQPAVLGLISVLAYRSDLWQANRIQLAFTAVVGVLQLLGLVLSRAPYNLSTPFGVLLPLVFVEWLLTPLLIFITDRTR